jgi:hypothetical protein
MQSISENTQNNIFHSGSVGTSGALAPLVLIKGHLRTNDYYDDDIPLSNLSHCPMRRNSNPVKGWFKPVDLEYTCNPFVAKVQPFASGGYEVVIAKIDLEKIARVMDSERKTGKREKREQNENDVISSKQRSQKKVRYLVKSMGCDRMFTFTRRETIEGGFWTAKEWRDAWKKFNRLCLKAGCELSYVTTMEYHKKGNFHLHAAMCGHVSIKTMNGIWWAICGGRGMGNIDIKFRGDLSPSRRRAGLARYLSKYITKQDCTEFNKKRYWSSRHELPAAVRYVLKADELSHCLVELSQKLNLHVGMLLDVKRVFRFPSGMGAWFNYDDDLAVSPPF